MDMLRIANDELYEAIQRIENAMYYIDEYMENAELSDEDIQSIENAKDCMDDTSSWLLDATTCIEEVFGE